MPVNNYALYGKLNSYIENSVFKAANLVSFTNAKTFYLYKFKYPSSLNFDIVPHLVNVDDFYEIKKSIDNLLVRVGYVGAFHKNIREPNLAIEKLSQIDIDGLRFEFYGPLNGIIFNDSRFVNHYGVVNRDKAICLSKEFDILIILKMKIAP